MGKERHIIHRVNLNIEAPDVKTAKNMQDVAAPLFYNDILPKLESWLDELLPKEQTIRIERLDLELGRLDPSGFNEQFEALAVGSFRKQIEQLLAPSTAENTLDAEASMQSLPAEQRLFDLFLYFLETGRKPWWSGDAEESLDEEVLSPSSLFSSAERIERFLGLMRSEGNSIERLLKQFSGLFVSKLVIALLQARSRLEQEAIDLILGNHERLDAGGIVRGRQGSASRGGSRFTQVEGKEGLPGSLSPEDHLRNPEGSGLASEGESPFREAGMMREAFLRKIILKLAASHEPLDLKGLEALYAAILSEGRNGNGEAGDPVQAAKSARKDNSRTEQVVAREEEAEGIYLDHSGLVILHPFIEYFFREFDLLEDGGFRDQRSRTMAIHLLYFLATGKEQPAEHLLTFGKFICGAELAEPVDRFVELSRAMKDEGEILLKAAIGHWRALKNTSPDGLREGFLQRPGKLLLNGFENRLVVECKTHDVLLSYLPWGYGMVRLPWMARTLFVDWLA
ncbi:MAG: hypothetical protein HGB22_00245 [Chlorobiaceae bacterium]|nr:hypothetical protein [Chlorobiaceae bacterium]